MKEAFFYTKLGEQKVKCDLCPQDCTIHESHTGNCRVRTNHQGSLFSDNYGKLSGYHLDPIEKKPLYHFYPGKFILSIGSFGCNMHCRFCQNYEISQCGANSAMALELSPDSVVNDALRKNNNIGIAYTYNEPLVFYEFMRDTALLAMQYHLKNVMVTNGYFKPEPLEKMLVFIDAFSVDLKAFNNDFYRKYTSSGISEVKESLVKISKSGRHLEVTNLVIPELNDDVGEFKDMIQWIGDELGEKTVLHLSRYFPRYKLTQSPTPENTLMEFYQIASEKLDFVYIGNLTGNQGQNTICPVCKNLLIKRTGYYVEKKGIKPDGNCTHCNTRIIEHN
jgi:pyruvate formate lyase activating enzyme